MNLYKGSVSNAAGLPVMPGLRRLTARLAPHHERLRASSAALAAGHLGGGGGGGGAGGVGSGGGGGAAGAAGAFGAAHGVTEDQVRRLWLCVGCLCGCACFVAFLAGVEARGTQ